MSKWQADLWLLVSFLRFAFPAIFTAEYVIAVISFISDNTLQRYVTRTRSDMIRAREPSNGWRHMKSYLQSSRRYIVMSDFGSHKWKFRLVTWSMSQYVWKTVTRNLKPVFYCIFCRIYKAMICDSVKLRRCFTFLILSSREI